MYPTQRRRSTKLKVAAPIMLRVGVSVQFKTHSRVVNLLFKMSITLSDGIKIPDRPTRTPTPPERTGSYSHNVAVRTTFKRPTCSKSTTSRSLTYPNVDYSVSGNRAGCASYQRLFSAIISARPVWRHQHRGAVSKKGHFDAHMQ